MTYYRDTLESLAKDGVGGWLIMRPHVPEKCRALGDAISKRFREQGRLRLVNKELTRENDGLRDDIARLTSVLESSEQAARVAGIREAAEKVCRLVEEQDCGWSYSEGRDLADRIEKGEG